MISRAVFARGANQQYAVHWRRRLALALGEALRHAGLDTSAPAAAGTLGECFAVLFAELGVDATSGAVDVSKHASHSNRQRVSCAREAAPSNATRPTPTRPSPCLSAPRLRARTSA
jgi:hypothetical protein